MYKVVFSKGTNSTRWSDSALSYKTGAPEEQGDAGKTASLVLRYKDKLNVSERGKQLQERQLLENCWEGEQIHPMQQE